METMVLKMSTYQHSARDDLQLPNRTAKKESRGKIGTGGSKNPIAPKPKPIDWTHASIKKRRLY